jgi:PEP-CTERM motif
MVSLGQGTVFFANLDNPQVNAPVYQADGVTKLSGPQFRADLFGGPSADTLAFIATTAFLTGSGAGYFSGGPQAVSGVAPGDYAWIQVNVWNTASGNTFADARASGLPNSWWQSSVFSVIAGGETITPTPPAPLTGLGMTPVFLNGIPEPPTMAILGLGLGFLAFGRFKRRSANRELRPRCRC